MHVIGLEETVLSDSADPQDLQCLNREKVHNT